MVMIWGVVYIVLVLGDFLETRYAVSRWSPEVENNPFWQIGFRRRSKAVDWLYLIGALAICRIAYMLLDRLSLLIFIAMFALTNCNNVVAIIRMRRRERVL